jgi:hypothetical protein
MKIKDIENICWICGRTKEELENPFEDVPFIIPLYDLKDQVMYSGYHICGICESIILTIGGHSDKFVEIQIDEKLEELKEELIQKLIEAIRDL